MKLAIFDFDGTIIKGNSGFMWILMKWYKLSFVCLFYGVFYFLGLCPYNVWIKRAIYDLRNESAKENLIYFKNHNKNLCNFKYNKNVINELISFYKKGYKIIIITQSINFIIYDFIKNLEKEFNVKIYKLYCTKVEIKNDRFVKVIPVVGNEKQKYFKFNDLKESYFFTDSSRDKNLLEKVKYAFVVNPNPLFWFRAKFRGWRIIKG